MIAPLNNNSSPRTSPPTGSGLAPHLASLLCYFCGFLTGIIFLLIEKDDREVRFHAWNAIAVDVATFLIYMALSFFGLILSYIAGPLELLVSFLKVILVLVYIGVKIALMIKAYQGEKIFLPVLGDIVEKQASK